MSMDASRLPRRAQPAPVVQEVALEATAVLPVAAAPETAPEPAAQAAPAPAPQAQKQAQPVGKLDPITLGVLASVRPCSTPVEAVAVEPGLDDLAAPAPSPAPERKSLLIGVAVALLGGAAWLFAGSRAKPALVSAGRPPVTAPNIPMPAHVPTRMSPLSRPEFAGFVVVGG